MNQRKADSGILKRFIPFGDCSKQKDIAVVSITPILPQVWHWFGRMAPIKVRRIDGALGERPVRLDDADTAKLVNEALTGLPEHARVNFLNYFGGEPENAEALSKWPTVFKIELAHRKGEMIAVEFFRSEGNVGWSTSCSGSPPSTEIS